MFIIKILIVAIRTNSLIFGTIALSGVFFALLPGVFSQSESRPVSHVTWDQMLRKHVSPDGMVNYKGFITDRSQLSAYLKILASSHPSGSWTDKEKLAYWINAYNAFTIDLILQHYPLKSINNIREKGKGPWDIPIIEIQGKQYTLNDLEHKILRKNFSEPRIHFAVNCASVSCPVLRNEAYTPEKLEFQLEDQARKFINDAAKNKVSASRMELSRIFEWFSEDFTRSGSLTDFINRYSRSKASSDAAISWLEYDWQLNE